PDLRVAVMSATIDGTAVARLLDDAPVVTSAGRQFEVETRHLSQPATSPRIGRFDAEFVGSVVRAALRDTHGDILVFLPGAPEIHRVFDLLEPAANTDVFALHGSLERGDQDR